MLGYGYPGHHGERPDDFTIARRTPAAVPAPPSRGVLPLLHRTFRRHGTATFLEKSPLS